jgi:hypothetical protein
VVEITSNSVRVFSESIIPAIQLEIVEELEDDTLLLKVEGFVLAQDKKYIANVLESTFSPGGKSYRGKANVVNRGATDRITHRREIMFTLDKNALDHLEELRQISEKKDVIMELVLSDEPFF